MDRRAFLGILPVVGLCLEAVIEGKTALEKDVSLPTSIPGYPQYKVLHFHFDAGVIPEITGKHGVQTVQVPTLCFGARGNVLSSKDKEFAVPLSDPAAQKGLIENMQHMAKCLVSTHDDNKYISLVTSGGSDGLVYHVGICATSWRPRRPSWPTWS